ncbi:MAG: helix-turn-helix domain-containing protein [Burkholderiaceae bacterium]|nr:helix-turn-helix domain-containing protein [Burkholderiaceae bacterium]
MATPLTTTLRQRLLARLRVTPGVVVSAHDLARAMWFDRPWPAGWRHTLSAEISRLRWLLPRGEAIRTAHRRGYALIIHERRDRTPMG